MDAWCLSADPRSIPGGSAVCGTQLVTNFPMLSVKQSSDGGQANDRRQEGTNGGAVSGRRKNPVTRPSVIIAPATRSQQFGAINIGAAWNNCHFHNIYIKVPHCNGLTSWLENTLITMNDTFNVSNTWMFSSNFWRLRIYGLLSHSFPQIIIVRCTLKHPRPF